MSATQTITIELPRNVIDAAIMKRLDIVAPLPAALATSAANDLPAIGAAFQGGIYVGITLDGDKPAALVVLPGDFEGNWKDAQAWAQQQGGELPSRIDGLVLLQNVKSEFREAYYWTNTQLASYSAYAWLQSFDNGDQNYNRIGNDYRARAVRRFPI